jgi:hypothetical protein
MASRAKKPSPGQDFEDSFRASLPKGVYIRRLRTPTAMGFLVPQLVRLVEGLSANLRRPVPEWAAKAARFRFTAKAGFDLLLTAQAAGCLSAAQDYQANRRTGADFFKPLTAYPAVVFALELKSVDGASIPFANVDPDQEKALSESASAGHVAGLVIEFRKAGEAWFLPIQVWREYRLTAQRASLPLDDARRLGMPILRDEGRGRSLPYWAVGAFLKSCGAEIS